MENFLGQAVFVNESSLAKGSPVCSPQRLHPLSIFPYSISVPQEICADIDVLCPVLIGFTGSNKETDTSLFAFNR